MYLLCFDPWASLEAASAVIMAVFTVRLFFVSRDQQRISEAQQSLMEEQHRLAIEMGRGVLTLQRVIAQADNLYVQFKNTGKSHLSYGTIKWHAWEQFPKKGLDPWENTHEKGFTTTLEPDEVGEQIALELPDSCFVQKGLAKDTYCIAFRVVYTTLGTERAIRTAWTMNLSNQQSRAYGTRRWIGRAYEYDVPLAIEESRSRL